MTWKKTYSDQPITGPSTTAVAGPANRWQDCSGRATPA